MLDFQTGLVYDTPLLNAVHVVTNQPLTPGERVALGVGSAATSDGSSSLLTGVVEYSPEHFGFEYVIPLSNTLFNADNADTTSSSSGAATHSVFVWIQPDESETDTEAITPPISLRLPVRFIAFLLPSARHAQLAHRGVLTAQSERATPLQRSWLLHLPTVTTAHISYLLLPLCLFPTLFTAAVHSESCCQRLLERPPHSWHPRPTIPCQ